MNMSKSGLLISACAYTSWFAPQNSSTGMQQKYFTQKSHTLTLFVDAQLESSNGLRQLIPSKAHAESMKRCTRVNSKTTLCAWVGSAYVTDAVECDEFKNASSKTRGKTTASYVKN